MAKRRSQDISQSTTNTFLKGLNKDSDPSFVQEGMWTHARNAVNNTAEGDVGTLSNESANYLCSRAGETILNGRKVIVGIIHLYSDKWVIYTAVHVPNQINSVNSEIGLFEEDRCRYRPIVQDPCLNFNELNLITGASREKEDCSWQVYWADALNPDRYLNIGDPQTWPGANFQWSGNNTYISTTGEEMKWPGVEWNQDCDTVDGCVVCTDLNTLNCDKIRLARLMTPPCINLSFGNQGGGLYNGSYMALVAYTIKGQRVTDWFSPSNIQPLWFEIEPRGSLELSLDLDKENFEEFVLCIVSSVNENTVAKQFGFYSTNTNKILIDYINEELISIPLNELPLQNPVYEKSDQIVEVNNYLLRVGPTSKFDFNYQPLANLIKTNWVSVEYPYTYYRDGGHKPSYLRDEVYSFFIRWIYDTGDKSASYHIPGRPATTFNGILETQNYTSPNTLITTPGEQEKYFEVVNTATISSITQSTLDDGGVVIARGNMAYWQSTEVYPDNQPEIWNSSAHCWTGTTNSNYDLCGKPIRHHKMPDNTTDVGPNALTNHYGKNPADQNSTIRILGVEFENIIFPKDNDGNDIPGIIGYEILRGSREGNKSIVAKGMVNNLRPYNIVSNNARGRKGLYPNHPFNTIQPVNPDANSNGPLNNGNQANDPYIIAVDQDDDRINVDIADIPQHIITFHSPDTNFTKPYLSTSELKLYGYFKGISDQYFIEPNEHPSGKLVSNVAMFAGIVGGLIDGLIGMLGQRTINVPYPVFTREWYLPSVEGTTTTPTQDPLNALSETQYFIYEELFTAALNTYYNGGGAISEAFIGTPQLQSIYQQFVNNVQGNSGITIQNTGFSYLQPGIDLLPNSVQIALTAAGGVSHFFYYFAEGAEATLRLIYSLLPYRQYALQMLAHGFYDGYSAVKPLIYRFKLEDEFYLKNVLHDLQPYFNGSGLDLYRINNIKRQSTVVLRTKNGAGLNDGPDFITGNDKDNSLVTIGTARNKELIYNSGEDTKVNFGEDKKVLEFNAQIASHYAGLKYRIRNQYGQLNSIKQIPITPCEQIKDATVTTGNLCGLGIEQKKIQRTGIFFNGDTYITRYTEKNNMFFFNNWLYGEPDGFEYNYLINKMLPKPRFWMNSEKYDLDSIIPSSFSQLLNPIPGTGLFPRNYYRLDNRNYDYSNDSVFNYPGFFGVKESYFYLATSAVRDFFVESDYIVDFRESGNEVFEQHYDPYKLTDLSYLFDINPKTITLGNYYSYDQSLMISRFFTQYFSQGNLQSRYYNPYVASLCYQYYPDRIIYSLPQQDESLKDSWFIYLPNNYKEFKDQISGVKNFAKTGIFITFKNTSPLVFQGVDQLQTEFGTKINIGDGGLFAQTPQSVVVSDKPYEYGSSQDSRSVISTPAGLFYVSQNQGKLFSFSGGLSEVSKQGMKWWFTLFLPYKLLQDFPDYPHTDNPVAGIGCQSIYDNLSSILYFTKKDYQLKDQYKGQVIYDPVTNHFIYRKTKFKFSDEDIRKIFFNDASWTISYDPKNQFFISFHDWHPDLLMPGKNTFLSTKANGIWKHNYQCDKFCNYYGVNYPFEVELPIITGQSVTTLRSMEYILENYRRVKGNCVDQFHVLDYNFDKAVVYNSEQVSGYLNLNLFPKNNVPLSLQYPQVNPNSIDILFSKEEQKYRFNQFWDITKDRGEFPVGSSYPPTGPVIPGTTILDGPTNDQNIWITDPNGYTRTLNAANLDYNKSEMQRKKFRHYLNFLSLSKTVSNDTNMILKIVNNKSTYSPR